MSREIKFAILVLFGCVPMAAHARIHDSGVYHFQEEQSFGTNINPDAPAKPANDGPYQRHNAEPPDIKPAEGVSVPVEAATQENQQPVKRPKYRDVYEQASKHDRSYGDEDSVTASINVGFSFKSFSGGLGLTFPLNHYMAWGISGGYSHREEKNEQEIISDFDLSLIFKVPNPTPLTPFVSAGPGLKSWKRSQDLGKGMENFDVDHSPTANWSVGASMRLARYVALVGALQSSTYTDTPPRKFLGDHSLREDRTSEKFVFGFAFVF